MKIKTLYAPWRNSYVTKKKPKNVAPEKCVFCTKISSQDDDANLIVKRFKNCTLMLNLYPYSAGHLLLLPNEHKSELCELEESVRAEMMEILNQSVEVLKAKFKAEGINVGVNLGIAGGGGIPSHLHFHAIPRWKSDTNFFATIGATRVACTSFAEVLEKVRAGFNSN
jgi:ATP adenylyltransferase